MDTEQALAAIKEGDSNEILAAAADLIQEVEKRSRRFNGTMAIVRVSWLVQARSFITQARGTLV